MLSHSWICTVTFAPVAFSNAVLTAAVAWSLRSRFISHTVSCPPPGAAAGPGEVPQAVRARVSVPTTAARERLFTGQPPRVVRSLQVTIGKVNEVRSFGLDLVVSATAGHGV